MRRGFAFACHAWGRKVWGHLRPSPHRNITWYGVYTGNRRYRVMVGVNHRGTRLRFDHSWFARR